MANENLNKKALKAGIWFTICNFATRGILFLTAPIFARLLTKAEYGDFANYSSWMSILTLLTTLDLHASINNAKVEYQNDLDSYISSILITGTVFTTICYIIVLIFQSFFIEMFGMDMIYIHSMFLILLFSPALTIYQTRNNVLLEYKKVAIVSFISTIVSTLFSIIFVLYSQDKLYGRIMGVFTHSIVINIPLYIYLIKKNNSLKKEYVKYALTICLPLIPHILSHNLLNTSDRLMIKHFCGAEPTALYSIIHTCSIVITILLNSLNTAWVPWFFDKLKNEEYQSINEVYKTYIRILSLAAIVFMLMGPELILFFGGEKYLQSLELIPPNVLGCFFHCLYTLYVNIEFYYKKTILISIMTIIAASFNIITNYIFIPKYGYISAAYTTLVSYLLLVALHYLACRSFKPEKYFSIKRISILIVLMLIASICILWIYDKFIIRLIIMSICSIILFIKLKQVKTFI